VLLCLDWRLALVSLAVLPLDAGLMSLAGRASRRFAQQMAEEAARVTAGSYEALANIRTIQALQVEAAFDRRMSGLLGGVAAVRARASLVTSGTGFLAASFRTAGGLVYGWVGWCRVLEGDLSIGTFLAFSGYVGYLYGPLDGLIGLWPELQATLVRARRFAEVYQRQPRIAERPELPVLSGVRGEIAFCGVSFRYGDTPVLRRVDLRIAAGSTVALVGRSGAGKSTLAKLIPRFYDPDEGAVRVDGADVRSYRLGSLRRQVGFALQGSGVFQGTVLDNLTLGRGFSLPEVEHASRLAGFHEFVTSLPHGYHTVVGEQGVGLSEGQKQRLALARVLLVDAPVLILDEPTSALDPESERAVQEALQLARQGRTTLLVTHRLTAVRQADEIVVLDAGEVVERGDHTALMAKGGVYAALYEATAPTMLGAAQRKETDQCPCARWSTIPRPFGQARLHTGSGALNQERMKQHGQAQQGAPGLLPPTRCVGNGAGLRR
jgi:ABC-type multidrug transport system fused ATPase/permease subunit